MQRTLRSFINNVKERKNVAFFWKELMPNPAVFVVKFCINGDFKIINILYQEHRNQLQASRISSSYPFKFSTCHLLNLSVSQSSFLVFKISKFHNLTDFFGKCNYSFVKFSSYSTEWCKISWSFWQRKFCGVFWLPYLEQ